MNGRRLLPHALILWCLAPILLSLSAWRPAGGDHGRARALPLVVGGFVAKGDEAMRQGDFDLLGTTDAILRIYRQGEETVYLFAVFHDENWKSVHAPDTCLRGSGLEVIEDSTIRLDTAIGTVPAGRLLMGRPTTGERYLSVFGFVAAPDFVTGSYWSFFLHHLPRAIFRESVAGCLLRVETNVGADGVEAADRRCRSFLSALLPIALESLR